MQLLELMDICTKLSDKVTTLENELKSTKAVYNKALTTLTKKVKKLKKKLKHKRRRAVVDSSEDEEAMNIKKSTTKDKGKAIMQESEPPKKIKKKEMIQISLDEEIAQREKRLEKKKKSRTHELKRLYKVGLSARVKSSDEESLGEEHASKQERKIANTGPDKGLTLIDETTED
nr:hypothetical protein [Tanacetum cinerariifolium]